MYDVTTKLEINATGNLVDLNDLVKTAAQSRAAAVVVRSPELVPHVQFLRQSTGGRFKVILAVDFDSRGSNFVLAKFHTLHPSWTEADGFDILLSPRSFAMETKNEISVLSAHLRSMNPMYELRFCINMLNFDSGAVANMLKFLHAQVDPRPNFIRLDQNTEMPARFPLEYGPKCMQIIRNVTHLPVKLSTNVTLEAIRELREFARFDVSLKQAKHIIAELRAEMRGEVRAPAVDTMEVVEESPFDGQTFEDPRGATWIYDASIADWRELSGPDHGVEIQEAEEPVSKDEDSKPYNQDEDNSEIEAANVRVIEDADGKLVVEEVSADCASAPFEDPIEQGKYAIPEVKVDAGTTTGNSE